jgi:small subunit ribosomal protein S1
VTAPSRPGVVLRRTPETAPLDEAASAPTEAASRPVRAPIEAAPVAPVARTPVDENAPAPTTDDFAALFEQTDVDFAMPQVGDSVRGRVLGWDDESVFVDLGGKSEGVISTGELVDARGQLSVAVGDSIEARVVRTSGGTLQLSRGFGRGAAGTEALAEAHASGIPVEGRVTGTNKGGFDIDVLGARGFCPFSQIDVAPSEPETHVGQTYRFLITRLGDRDVVLSRSQLQREEREERAREVVERLGQEDVFEGRVTRIEPYGAFVDLGGIEGLVHVSELDYARVEDPNDVVRVGEWMQVRVLSVENADDPRQRRIRLSRKALQEDPWIAAVRDWAPGLALHGRVSRVESFGAFVELAPGIDGLVHISELAPGRRLSHASQAVEVGESLEVELQEIDPLKRQIRLALRGRGDTPWDTAAENWPPGTTVQGEIVNATNFGFFVRLPSGIDALLPLSQLAEGEDRTARTRFHAGAVIEARVLEIDRARGRMTLTRREDTGTDETSFRDWKRSAQSAQGGSGFGTLGDLLRAKGKG